MSDPEKVAKFIEASSESWLEGLDQEESAYLCGRGEFVQLNEGDVLIEQGKVQPFLYLVISGSLEVMVSADSGKPTRVKVVEAGESLGEMTLFNEASATASVMAIESAELWRMPQKEFLPCWEDQPRMVATMLISLFCRATSRLREMNPAVAQMMQKDGGDEFESSPERRKRLEIARKMMAARQAQG